MVVIGEGLGRTYAQDGAMSLKCGCQHKCRALPGRSCGDLVLRKLNFCVILWMVFKIWLLGSDKPTTLSAKESCYLSRLIGL